MVRAVSTDFLHSMRFFVDVAREDGTNPTQIGGAGTAAGFSACTTPELSSEVVEYKEGNFIYPRKYPGNPSVSDITMSRGVARLDSTFWLWMQGAVEGGPLDGQGNYRTDVSILHFHRDTTFAAEIDLVNGKQQLDLTVPPARTYICHEAFPIRHKVSADLDATASEISVMELDVSMEYFVVQEST